MSKLPPGQQRRSLQTALSVVMRLQSLLEKEGVLYEHQTVDVPYGDTRLAWSVREALAVAVTEISVAIPYDQPEAA